MKKKITSLFLCMLLILVFLNNVDADDSQTNKMIVKEIPINDCNHISDEIIDDIGWFTSLALDDNNIPHICYYDYTNGDLKYARWTGSDWAIESLDTNGDVGRYTSIALSDDGHPHISYYDKTNGNLKYAHGTGSIWSISTVDSFGNVGLYTSIALDSQGLAHISYCDYTNRNLKYAHYDGSSWQKNVVDNSGDMCIFEYFSDYTSIAIDSNDRPHISYCDFSNFNLKYANQFGSSWIIDVVDNEENVGTYSSLVLDDNDDPHISYGDITNENFDLRYAFKKEGSWNIEIADSEGDIRKWTSLKLDSEGNPHISFYDYYEGSLKYTYYDGDDWNVDIVESEGSTGCFNCLAMDSSDNPCISYYDWGSKAIKYATNTGDGWNIQTIEIDTNTDFLDQEQKYCCGWAYIIDDTKPIAQSFKPTFKTLTRVELMVVKRYNPGDFRLSIRENLNGNDLTSINLSSDEIAEDLSWKVFDFPDIEVIPGQTYYIVCTTYDVASYDAYFCYYGINDEYEDGEAWIKSSSWKEISISGFPDPDFGFKTFGLDTGIPDITLNGPNNGKIRTELIFTLESVDPDDEDISFCIDWGDGNIEYTVLYPSGSSNEIGHTWNRINTFLVKAKAIDINGAESDWDTLEVSIPRDKILHSNGVLRILYNLFGIPILKSLFYLLF